MSKPNVVFVLLDDMGWRDLGCTGSDFYETPHIDRFARESLNFTSAYASCPVCSPSRASVLTGKYPATVGITDWIDHKGKFHPLRGKLIEVPYIKNLPHSEKTLAESLREGGYATWHLGKWHLGGEGHYPTDHGFDVNVGGCEMGNPAGKGGSYFSPWKIPGLENAETPDGTYLPDYLTTRAIDLIERCDDQPFYMNFWFYLVHTPIQAKAEKIAKYEEKARRLGLDQLKIFEEGEEFPTTDKKGRHVRRRLLQSDAGYAAMIESLDENFGRLRTSLEAAGKWDNTIIIFTSDNGGLSTA